jgi:hypothetical protein
VRVISYFCTCHRLEFLLNKIPAVIRAGNVALSDNGGGVKDRLFAYFAIYQQLIVR